MLNKAIREFIKESNKIERIYQYPREKQFNLYMDFFSLPSLSVSDICNFVNIVAGPDAVLRDRFGLNVTVDNHEPMPGGDEVRSQLVLLLSEINNSDVAVFAINKEFDEAIAKGRWDRNFDPEHLAEVRYRRIFNECNPFRIHNRFVHLHPFMDGNGRSGRALWARQMHRHLGYDFSCGFLHTFYYQTLNAADQNYNMR